MRTQAPRQPKPKLHFDADPSSRRCPCGPTTLSLFGLRVADLRLLSSLSLIHCALVRLGHAPDAIVEPPLGMTRCVLPKWTVSPCQRACVSWSDVRVYPCLAHCGDVACTNVRIGLRLSVAPASTCARESTATKCALTCDAFPKFTRCLIALCAIEYPHPFDESHFDADFADHDASLTYPPGDHSIPMGGCCRSPGTSSLSRCASG